MDGSHPQLSCRLQKCSPGCSYCYACKEVQRMAGNPNPKVSDANKGLTYMQDNGVLNWTGKVRLLPERLVNVFEFTKPTKVFVNSLSDMFFVDDEDPTNTVPEDFIRRSLAVFAAAPWCTFQVLTKRAERLRELSPRLEWAGNVWMGVSVES